MWLNVDKDLSYLRIYNIYQVKEVKKSLGKIHESAKTKETFSSHAIKQ